MRSLAKPIVAAALAAALIGSTSGMAFAGGFGGAAVPFPGVAVTVPPLEPATPPVGSYCATPARTCLLRQAGYVGAQCSCRVRHGHAVGSIVAQ